MDLNRKRVIVVKLVLVIWMSMMLAGKCEDVSDGASIEEIKESVGQIVKGISQSFDNVEELTKNGNFSAEFKISELSKITEQLKAMITKLMKTKTATPTVEHSAAEGDSDKKTDDPPKKTGQRYKKNPRKPRVNAYNVSLNRAPRAGERIYLDDDTWFEYLYDAETDYEFAKLAMNTKQSKMENPSIEKSVTAAFDDGKAKETAPSDVEQLTIASAQKQTCRKFIVVPENLQQVEEPVTKEEILVVEDVPQFELITKQLEMSSILSAHKRINNFLVSEPNTSINCYSPPMNVAGFAVALKNEMGADVDDIVKRCRTIHFYTKQVYGLAKLLGSFYESEIYLNNCTKTSFTMKMPLKEMAVRNFSVSDIIRFHAVNVECAFPLKGCNFTTRHVGFSDEYMAISFNTNCEKTFMRYLIGLLPVTLMVSVGCAFVIVLGIIIYQRCLKDQTIYEGEIEVSYYEPIDGLDEIPNEKTDEKPYLVVITKE